MGRDKKKLIRKSDELEYGIPLLADQLQTFTLTYLSTVTWKELAPSYN
jgi:hypothetical protein